MKGMLITFEGGEGCGKSTHSKLLMQYLKSKGHKVVRTLEPGATLFGKKLRRILLNEGGFSSGFTELFLFAVDRLEHVNKVIMPYLRKGYIVISDRYIDSTTAYQAGGRGLREGIVDMVNKISSSGIKPDLTLLLDVDPKVGIRRGTIRTGKDRFESENTLFHDKVRKAYMRLAKNEPKRICVVPTALPRDIVQKIIRRIVDEKLGN